MAMCASIKTGRPQQHSRRVQRRSAAERSFAPNAVPEPPEEPPLQTWPRDLLRAHVFEAVSLWDLGRLGCAATWLAETVFDDQKAWERRNGLLVGGLQCMHGGVLGATRAGRVAERCWTAILTAATEAPRPTTTTPYCAAAWVAVNIEARRREAAAGGGGGARRAVRAAAPRRARARASIDAEASLDGFPRTPRAAAGGVGADAAYAEAGGTARAVSLVATSCASSTATSWASARASTPSRPSPGT